MRGTHSAPGQTLFTSRLIAACFRYLSPSSNTITIRGIITANGTARFAETCQLDPCLDPPTGSGFFRPAALRFLLCCPDTGYIEPELDSFLTPPGGRFVSPRDCPRLGREACREAKACSIASGRYLDIKMTTPIATSTSAMSVTTIESKIGPSLPMAPLSYDGLQTNDGTILGSASIASNMSYDFPSLRRASFQDARGNASPGSCSSAW